MNFSNFQAVNWSEQGGHKSQENPIQKGSGTIPLDRLFPGAPLGAPQDA